MVSELIIRSASEDDVAAIVELVESAYRGDSSRQGWTTEADLLEGQRVDAQGVREIMSNENSKVLLAIDGASQQQQGANEQTIVGCCQIQHLDDNTTYVGMFAVSPKLQGAGVGRAIITRGEAIARDENNAKRMRMSVIKQRSELIAWYERLGYERNGEKLPFPYGDERFGIPQRDDLEFVVLVKTLS